jgi:hypothetical protein
LGTLQKIGHTTKNWVHYPPKKTKEQMFG